MVDVEEAALGGLEQDVLALGDGALEEAGRVGDVRAELLAVTLVLLEEGSRVEGAGVGGEAPQKAIFPLDDSA